MIHMAMKMGEIRSMKEDALQGKLNELEMEMVAGQSSGTKVNSIRLSIARIKSHLHELKNPKKAGQKRAKRPVVSQPKIVAGGKQGKQSRASSNL